MARGVHILAHCDQELPTVEADCVAGGHPHVDDLLDGAGLQGHARIGLLARLEHPQLLGADHEADAVSLEHVRDPDEAGYELGGRPLVDLDRRAYLLDAAVGHHGHAIAHGQRLFLVVRDVDEGDPDLLLDPLQLELHLLPELQVERTKRLVEQQHLWLVDHRSRERDPLSLST